MIEYPVNLTKKNAISPGDCRNLIGSEAFRSFSYSDVTDNFIELFGRLGEKLEVDLPVGIVHGDVFPDNTLFRDRQLVGLIDFEEFAIDKLMFDVGMTMNGFCFDGLVMHTDLVEVFVKRYDSIRQFTVEEINLMVDYMCWGAVGMTSWHLHQLLYRKNKVQLKRVRTLLERARLIERERSSLEKHIAGALSQG